ncbi:MAG: DUF4365 domain-containing protein [Novosphingobium sp.]|nr:DUF4365 domain-containing protein [Novosphingobium sp.]
MFYHPGMAKRITDNQLIGELGEAAVRKRFLSMGFQFDSRSRLEAGIDGLAEVMIDGEPTARMIAVQIKSTRAAKYTSETETGFTYLLDVKDLAYWKTSNLPVIVVMYRESDDSHYWAQVPAQPGVEQRRLTFDKTQDVLDKSSLDRLAALTVPINGFGYYVPPLGGGETALVNFLPITLPTEIFVASTAFDRKSAIKEMYDTGESARYDWVIKDGTFWSFHDPREAVTGCFVDLDQVEAIETSLIGFHDDIDEQNNFAFLLRQTLQHQMQDDLAWDKDNKVFYVKAYEDSQPRTFHYQSAKVKTKADVVNVTMSTKVPGKVGFVRHHAFVPKFECMMDQWFLMVSPTYHFTTNGYTRHPFPDALLSGKKRMENNAAIRGQVIMWHRFLTQYESDATDLFTEPVEPTVTLRFDPPPEIELPTAVPDDVWGRRPAAEQDDCYTSGLLFDEV